MTKVIPYIIFFCYLFHPYNCGTLSIAQLPEQTLITSLLSGYNKNVKPNTPVEVDITASLQQIVSLDEKQQIMTSSLFISQAWVDDRLSWTPSANDNISVVMLPVQSLWIPDTMILNSADSNGYLTINTYSLASIDFTGSIYMILPALAVKTRCNLLIRNFPFDYQMCSINLTSWSQGSNRIVYTENASSVIDISEYIEHPLWKLKNISMDVIRKSDRVPYEYGYNDVITILLYLERKPLFYMLNGIFTCLILNCVTLLAFGLPFAAQIGLCMTCFMTYSVNSLTFSNLFPQQSEYLMMITLYFILSMCWTLISMLWFVICNYLTSKGELPKLLFVFSGLLQRISGNGLSKSKQNDSNGKKGELMGLSDAETTKHRCMSCEKIFSACLRRRVVVENADKPRKNLEEDVESVTSDTNNVASNPEHVIKTKEKRNPKCNFCDRCETCQVNFDRDKAKGKNKKDIEAKCNALNYLVFSFVSLCVFVSNVVLWLLMSS